MTVPQPSDGFEWVQAPHGSILRCTPLERYAHHFFTTGSLRLREDDREWDAVSALAGVRRGDLRLLRQVHGRTVVAVESEDGAGSTPPEADAAIARTRAVALVVRVADCAPILLADRVTGAVAAVHAGWRSTMQRIVEATITSMHVKYGTRPDDLVAAIGPSLGQCCGEMGDEVLDAFRTAGHDDESIEQWFDRQAGRRPHFDLWRANRVQLERSGVPSDAIYISGLCTRTHSDHFHSYRAAGSNAGRMAGVIRANR